MATRSKMSAEQLLEIQTQSQVDEIIHEEDEPIEFLATNNSPSDEAFTERTKYRDEAYPIMYPLPKPIDVWYNKGLYGKVDTNYNSVLTQDEWAIEMLITHSIKKIPTEDGEVFAMNFVVDAFEDLRAHMNEAANRGDVYSKGSVYVPMKPVRGWQSGMNRHKEYLTAIYQGFAGSFLEQNQNYKNVTDFKEFLKTFQDFLDRTMPDFPLSTSGYVLSKNFPLSSTGLTVELADGSYGDDEVKYKDFIEDKNFSFFAGAARKFGFRVDKNAPWRLIADVRSTKMQQYMANYPEKPLKPVDVGDIPVSPCDVAQQDLFKEYRGAKIEFIDPQPGGCTLGKIRNIICNENDFSSAAFQVQTYPPGTDEDLLDAYPAAEGEVRAEWGPSLPAERGVEPTPPLGQSVQALPPSLYRKHLNIIMYKDPGIPGTGLWLNVEFGEVTDFQTAGGDGGARNLVYGFDEYAVDQGKFPILLDANGSWGIDEYRWTIENAPVGSVDAFVYNPRTPDEMNDFAFRQINIPLPMMGNSTIVDNGDNGRVRFRPTLPGNYKFSVEGINLDIPGRPRSMGKQYLTLTVCQFDQNDITIEEGNENVSVTVLYDKLEEALTNLWKLYTFRLNRVIGLPTVRTGNRTREEREAWARCVSTRIYPNRVTLDAGGNRTRTHDIASYYHHIHCINASDPREGFDKDKFFGGYILEEDILNVPGGGQWLVDLINSLIEHDWRAPSTETADFSVNSEGEPFLGVQHPDKFNESVRRHVFGAAFDAGGSSHRFDTSRGALSSEAARYREGGTRLLGPQSSNYNEITETETNESETFTADDWTWAIALLSQTIRGGHPPGVYYLFDSEWVNMPYANFVGIDTGNIYERGYFGLWGQRESPHQYGYYSLDDSTLPINDLTTRETWRSYFRNWASAPEATNNNSNCMTFPLIGEVCIPPKPPSSPTQNADWTLANFIDEHGMACVATLGYHPNADTDTLQGVACSYYTWATPPGNTPIEEYLRGVRKSEADAHPHNIFSWVSPSLTGANDLSYQQRQFNLWWEECIASAPDYITPLSTTFISMLEVDPCTTITRTIPIFLGEGILNQNLVGDNIDDILPESPISNLFLLREADNTEFQKRRTYFNEVIKKYPILLNGYSERRAAMDNYEARLEVWDKVHKRGEFGGVLTFDNLFKRQFRQTIMLDIPILKEYILNVYNSYVFSHEWFTTTKIKKGGKGTVQCLKKREPITMTEMEKLYPEAFWLRFYLATRIKESRKNITASRLKNFQSKVDSILSDEATNGIQQVLKIIDEEVKGVLKEKLSLTRNDLYDII